LKSPMINEQQGILKAQAITPSYHRAVSNARRRRPQGRKSKEVFLVGILLWMTPYSREMK